MVERSRWVQARPDVRHLSDRQRAISGADTEATGDVDDLVAQLTEAADELSVMVRIIPEEGWTHGKVKGICERMSLVDVQPLVEVRDRESNADLARTLIHEYAHALFHFDINDDTERSTLLRKATETTEAEYRRKE